MSMPGVEASESELRERLTAILCATVAVDAGAFGGPPPLSP
jgi:hypothetical protein